MSLFWGCIRQWSLEYISHRYTNGKDYSESDYGSEYGPEDARQAESDYNSKYSHHGGGNSTLSRTRH